MRRIAAVAALALVAGLAGCSGEGQSGDAGAASPSPTGRAIMVSITDKTPFSGSLNIDGSTCTFSPDDATTPPTITIKDAGGTIVANREITATGVVTSTSKMGEYTVADDCVVNETFRDVAVSDFYTVDVLDSTGETHSQNVTNDATTETLKAEVGY